MIRCLPGYENCFSKDKTATQKLCAPKQTHTNQPWLTNHWMTPQLRHCSRAHGTLLFPSTSLVAKKQSTFLMQISIQPLKWQQLDAFSSMVANLSRSETADLLDFLLQPHQGFKEHDLKKRKCSVSDRSL